MTTIAELIGWLREHARDARDEAAAHTNPTSATEIALIGAQYAAWAMAVEDMQADLDNALTARDLFKAALDRKEHVQSVPYPQFCRHPDKCAGLGSCPRDPCCCD